MEYVLQMQVRRKASTNSNRGSRFLRNLSHSWNFSRRSTHVAYNNATHRRLIQPFVFLGGVLVLVLTPFLNRIPMRPILIFNLAGLGHTLMEFITYLDSEQRAATTGPTTIIYFEKRDPPAQNQFVFEIWRRLGKHRNIRLLRTSPFLWSCLSWVVFSGRTKNWLRGLHPDFSCYSSLPNELVRSLITETELHKFRDTLSRFLPSGDDPFCVVGIRDGAYYSDVTNRNSQVSDYLPTIELLLQRGHSVVRIGRPVLECLPIAHPRLFDYSTSSVTSDEMDVLLWLHASFAVGDSSGLTDAVTLLGSPVFCPTYPLDPRAFVSHANYAFATQRLRNKCSNRTLGLREVISLMNRGFNLGDERVIESLGLTTEKPDATEIRDSVEWYLDSVLGGDACALKYASELQAEMTNILASEDRDTWRHYRKDALYSATWKSMSSVIYPVSVIRLLAV